MRPRKVLDGDHKQPSKSGVVINGPRPTPLKLKQESHAIHKPPPRPPIIIYTRSPEVIHTKPHEFMALVQKLTGSHPTRSKDQDHQHQKKKTAQKQDDTNKRPMLFNSPPSNPCVNDIPLFTPSDYLCSPLRFYRFSDVASSSPNLNISLSPGSILEILKGLPEY